ncbi:MAG: hypothetical protein JWM53_2659, partial [bacterium]|nr:hypothetical protein [bacterium]
MIKLLLVVPLCIAVGCGGSKTAASPDLQAPPDMVVQGCQPPFGRSYIVSTLTMRQAGDGFDLNGDGTPDNQLGTLASFANPTWQDAITKGYAVYLLDVRDL